jgi:hypothetical protein
LAALVLPLCDAAVRFATANVPQYRESRTVVYAALGRFDAALDDFKEYLANGYPGSSVAESRRKWVELLTACQKQPAVCQNPFADTKFLRTIE